MTSETKPSQNLNISGGQLTNIQLGGQAGNNLKVSQSQQIGTEADQSLTSADVAVLLDQLKALLQSADLPDTAKEKAVRSIETAKDEVAAAEPDKEFAAKNLQRATQVFKDAGETVEAGTGLWQKLQPVLSQVGPWFGVAASFFA